MAIVIASFGSPIRAQTAPAVVSPLSMQIEPNGVNLANGAARVAKPKISVPADPRLEFQDIRESTLYIVGTILTPRNALPTSAFSVHYGGLTSQSFQCNDGDCKSYLFDGSTLTPFQIFRKGGTGETYLFNMKSSDISSTDQFNGVTTRNINYLVSEIDHPDGEQIKYAYYATVSGANTYYRVKSISSNTGYHIDLTYQSDDITNLYWGTVQAAKLYAPGVANPIQALTYNIAGSVTDIEGRTYQFKDMIAQYSGNINSLDSTGGEISLPSESNASTVITPYSPAIGGIGNRLISGISVDGVQWSYAYTNPGYDSINLHLTFDGVTVTGPAGYKKIYAIGKNGMGNQNVVTSETDELNRKTSYAYSSGNQLISIVYPEGNSQSISYDTYGNIIKKVTSAKPNSGIPDSIESAYVDTTHCGGVLCYRPIWYRDALSRQTDYVYNSQGLITQETDPADGEGVRRVIYISYDPHITAAGTTIYRKNVVRMCGTGAACGSGDEIRTEYDYWEDTFLPSAKREIDASAGLTQTTTYSYDSAGRLTSEDGPIAGSGDARYYRYDILGRRTWEVGPAGTGGVRVAVRTTYRDADDKAVLIETGTVTDPNNTTLAVTSQVAMSYDAHRNPMRAVNSAGGVTLGVIDQSFDDRGNRLCETTRMNFGSLPVDACMLCATCLQQGIEADRIVHNIYDVAGQLTQVQKAYGTPLVQNYASYTYTANGKQQYVTDAKGNKSLMAYDGLDRLEYWYFPAKSNPGAINGDDYEQYGYDAAGNRTSLKKRDGRVFSFTFDGLNRVIKKLVPDGCAPIQAGACPALTATRDIYYGYDVRGLQLYARFDSATGDGLKNQYDGVGRLKSSIISMQGVSRSLSFDYNENGYRTKITYPDSIFFNFTYDSSDHMVKVLDQTTAQLIDFGYDSLGRRISTLSGLETYHYDDANRLTDRGINFGKSFDTKQTFKYNSAGELDTQTGSNDAYAFSAYFNSNRAYASNGLNQYTTAGPAMFEYDADGNLISDGSSTYGYDAESRLISTSSGASLVYDPLGRLWQTSGGPAGLTQFLYDGDALVAEYDSSNTLLRRYVHGADAGDDPLLWYEGSGVTASQRRLMLADQRGSIDLITDGSGVQIAINSYDEYGIPSLNNVGRFQYTGQQWIPGIGMYYYKARVYSPTIGRFMQTDPVGYKDQMNLYAYVGNDPINHVDYSGETIEVAGTKEEKEQLNNAIIVVAKSDRGLAGRLKDLLASPNKHKIEFGSTMPFARANTTAIYKVGAEGLDKGGSPTETDIDKMYFSKNGKVFKDSGGQDIYEQIAHELFGHAWEADKGLQDYSQNSAGLEALEEHATESQNRYNIASGHKPEDHYGPMKLPAGAVTCPLCKAPDSYRFPPFSSR